jgi:hypothetical protein
LADQDTRILVVLANLMDLSKAGIPGMLLQLENALGVTLSDAREVGVYYTAGCGFFCC